MMSKLPPLSLVISTKLSAHTVERSPRTDAVKWALAGLPGIDVITRGGAAAAAAAAATATANPNAADISPER